MLFNKKVIYHTQHKAENLKNIFIIMHYFSDLSLTDADYAMHTLPGPGLHCIFIVDYLLVLVTPPARARAPPAPAPRPRPRNYLYFL